MYRPRAFAVDDQSVLQAFVRAHPFATLAAVVEGAVQFAYAPVVLDESGDARFHLARNNPLAGMADGAALRLSFRGPDAYVSPDWYASGGMVPTWNYSAAEGAGTVRRLDGGELHTLLVALSAAEEQKLLPKKPWTIDKVPAARMAGLLNAIVGFEVGVDAWLGKFKLSQDKTAEDFDGVRRGLDARGDADSIAVARDMQRARG